MNEQEILEYIKENDLDYCPECSNKKRNKIEHEGSEYVCTCSECGLTWIAFGPEDEIK